MATLRIQVSPEVIAVLGAIAERDMRPVRLVVTKLALDEYEARFKAPASSLLPTPSLGDTLGILDED